MWTKGVLTPRALIDYIITTTKLFMTSSSSKLKHSKSRRTGAQDKNHDSRSYAEYKKKSQTCGEFEFNFCRSPPLEYKSPELNLQSESESRILKEFIKLQRKKE